MQKTAITVFVIILCLTVVVCEKCGTPGNSRYSTLLYRNHVEQSLNNFDDGVKVAYECEDPLHPFLVGSKERTCLNGNWSASIPLCASRFSNQSNYNVTVNGPMIEVNFQKSTAVSGVNVTLFAVSDDVKVANVSMPGLVCERFSRNFDHIKSKINIINIICRMEEHSNEEKRIEMKFNVNLVQCNANGSVCTRGNNASFGNFEYFAITEDTVCGNPDLPPFSALKSVNESQFKNETLVEVVSNSTEHASTRLFKCSAIDENWTEVLDAPLGSQSGKDERTSIAGPVTIIVILFALAIIGFLVIMRKRRQNEFKMQEQNMQNNDINETSKMLNNNLIKQTQATPMEERPINSQNLHLETYDEEPHYIDLSKKVNKSNFALRVPADGIDTRRSEL